MGNGKWERRPGDEKLVIFWVSRSNLDSVKTGHVCLIGTSYQATNDRQEAVSAQETTVHPRRSSLCSEFSETHP